MRGEADEAASAPAGDRPAKTPVVPFMDDSFLKRITVDRQSRAACVRWDHPSLALLRAAGADCRHIDPFTLWQ